VCDVDILDVSHCSLISAGVAIADVQGSAGIVSDDQAASPGVGAGAGGAHAQAGAAPLDALSKRTRLLRLRTQNWRRPRRFLPKSTSLCAPVCVSTSPGPGQSADYVPSLTQAQAHVAPTQAAPTQTEMNRIEQHGSPKTPT
jgi:hypothetical protein